MKSSGRQISGRLNTNTRDAQQISPGRVTTMNNNPIL